MILSLLYLYTWNFLNMLVLIITLEIKNVAYFLLTIEDNIKFD